MSQTPDKKAIEAAANKHEKLVERLRFAFNPQQPGDVARYAKHDFKLGVEWRDKNPSPAVKLMAEALFAYKNGCAITEPARKALAAYEKSLK